MKKSKIGDFKLFLSSFHYFFCVLPSPESTMSSSAVRSSENLPPRTLARVAREVKSLLSNPPDGIKLVTDPETGMPSSLDGVVAEIEGPTGTPFEGKFFQLKLVLSADFPASPPRGFFLTKIYHPNVEASSGAICVNTLKKDWTATTTFSHVLSVIRCLLIVPFPESSLNDEAGKLFMESYDEYHRRARLMADVHGRPTPFDYESAADEDEESEDAMVGNMADAKPSASQSAVGGDDAKKAGPLDGADSPVKRSLKRGVSTGATNSSGGSSSGVGGSSGGGSQSNNTMRSLSSTSGINVLSRSNTGSLSSSGNSMKKIGADGKKKAVKKKKNNGLGRL